MKLVKTFLILLLAGTSISAGRASETLPALKDGKAPQNFEQMWAGFDPRAEPLEIEVLKEWEEEGVILKVVRYRIGVFKGKKAIMAAVYGFPKGGDNLPGLVQIHGGGQFAHHNACLTNAKRGYATISLAWAGRISATGYVVNATGVQLFWDGKTDDPAYKVTTDWGAVDGYHAPGKNPGNVFPSAKPAAWTLDEVESPRNSGWFLCALAARRALTFLEQQPEVDPEKLGVYGHSMGGKLTVMTAVDPRVKAAAPSCGGISDRHNNSALYRATLGDDVSLKKINCPIIFLSPSNDFHGRICDLPKAIEEINTDQWRVTCSPHHNHQDTPPYEVATMLWMDQHLKRAFSFPRTPKTTLSLKTEDGVPSLQVKPDRSTPVISIDVFYTQHGKMNERPEDRESTMHRFWHWAESAESDGVWTAKLPLSNVDAPLWVFAIVTYPLDEPVTGAGYYYGTYTATSFNVSSAMQIATPQDLSAAGSRATREPSLLIESFEGDWEKEWFTYKPANWARSTHKIGDEAYAAPDDATLAIDLLAQQPNTLVVVIDDYATEVKLTGGDQWQTVTLSPDDFRGAGGNALGNWKNIKRLKLAPEERLRPKRGSKEPPQQIGKNWNGPEPQFRNLHWITPTSGGDAVGGATFGRTDRPTAMLTCDQLRNYVKRFNAEDHTHFGQAISNEAAADWMASNVPLFECPDKDLEEIYHFRWWTFRKHIKQTEDGFVITEFLPKVNWSGRHNTISCPAGHHFREGRWIRDRKYLDDYALFWFRKGGSPRRYSFWAADSVYQYALTLGNFSLAIDLLPDLVANYEAWEESRLEPDGLFWQIDDRDGMEVSIGGSGHRGQGKRATINSYMFGDALAIAAIAERANQPQTAKVYRAKAAGIKKLVLEKLWDDDAGFFKVLPRGEAAELVEVRELHGFTPWYFNLPDKDAGYEVAWGQLMNPQGFYAPFGPTTAEQRHPKFSVSYDGHECQWNGPSWPFATSMTLTALANVLNSYPQQAVSDKDFFDVLKIYTKCHRLERADGTVLPWIDENLNPHTGDWIARSRLKVWKNGTWDPGKGGVERGKDYNHSSYCDLIISGLVGLRSRADDTVEVNPLLPEGTWDYFCLDGVPYHGHRLTILYDGTGKKYGMGSGLRILADGREIGSSPTLGRLTASMAVKSPPPNR